MEKSDSLFSVLIANYNNGRFIDEAIKSITNQTYTNWEIIIVDDASTDNSVQVLEKYRNDKRIKIYQNDKNFGCGFTKRKCVELACGEICGFLDSDDALTHDAIEAMIEAHKEHQNGSMIYSKLSFCDINMNLEKREDYARQIKSDSSYLFESTGRISHFVSFKKSFYDKTTGIDLSYKRAVDQDLYLKLEETGPVYFVDKTLYLYRRNPSGVSRESRTSAFIWNIIAKIDACRRRNINPEDVLLKFIPNEKEIRTFYENSWDYKMGKFILAPFRFIKHRVFSLGNKK